LKGFLVATLETDFVGQREIGFLKGYPFLMPLPPEVVGTNLSSLSRDGGCLILKTSRGFSSTIFVPLEDVGTGFSSALSSLTLQGFSPLFWDGGNFILKTSRGFSSAPSSLITPEADCLGHEEKGFLQLPCTSPFLGKRSTDFRPEKIMAENFPLKNTNPQKNHSPSPRLQDCSKNTSPEIFLPQNCKISLSCSKITRNLPPRRKICKQKNHTGKRQRQGLVFLGNIHFGMH
jgi:hypothetical protein